MRSLNRSPLGPRTIVSIAAALAIISIIGFLLCLVFQWPSQFVLGGPGDSRVTLADLVSGTVLSPPLIPWAILVVATLLARSQRWWGTTAIVLLCLLGVVFTIGGWGESFGPANPRVPHPVLVGSGVIWMVLGLSLTTFGLRELRARHHARQRAAHADAARGNS